MKPLRRAVLCPKIVQVGSKQFKPPDSEYVDPVPIAKFLLQISVNLLDILFKFENNFYDFDPCKLRKFKIFGYTRTYLLV